MAPRQTSQGPPAARAEVADESGSPAEAPRRSKGRLGVLALVSLSVWVIITGHGFLHAPEHAFPHLRRDPPISDRTAQLAATQAAELAAGLAAAQTVTQAETTTSREATKKLLVGASLEHSALEQRLSALEQRETSLEERESALELRALEQRAGEQRAGEKRALEQRAAMSPQEVPPPAQQKPPPPPLQKPAPPPPNPAVQKLEYASHASAAAAPKGSMSCGGKVVDSELVYWRDVPQDMAMQRKPSDT